MEYVYDDVVHIVKTERFESYRYIDHSNNFVVKLKFPVSLPFHGEDSNEEKEENHYICLEHIAEDSAEKTLYCWIFFKAYTSDCIYVNDIFMVHFDGNCSHQQTTDLRVLMHADEDSKRRMCLEFVSFHET
ncbi:CLUMA_CG014718, isoform A [Clunio marinus]|uniref:CLUMA_CG014718, isoform A n=1 Tax=Clunio marinus TaxID=568069 RepID=A0A1J1IMG9_9DIPT|nr:CLUMA_CG014718, isoform A [Clunio marinus]